MSFDHLPPTMSVEEASELLGISRRSAYRAASKGEIPTVRIGRRLIVPTPRLLTMLGVPAHEPASEVIHKPEPTAMAPSRP